MWNLLASALLAPAVSAFQPLKGYDPTPNPANVFEVGSARFTLLSPWLVRLEYQSSRLRGFQDEATLAFVHRHTNDVDSEVDDDGTTFTLSTKGLTLRYQYQTETPFNHENLQIEYRLQNDLKVWSPVPTYNVTKFPGNLLGTIRTLDGSIGPENLICDERHDNYDSHCTYGLISKEGYVVVDDTNMPQLDDTSSSWPWYQSPKVNQQDSFSPSCSVDGTERIDCGYPGISKYDCTAKGCCFKEFSVSSYVDYRPALQGVPQCFYGKETYMDWYFFGHGRNYKQAIFDYKTVGGNVPLPPRYIFGVFYSRYWAYADHELIELVEDYKDRVIPLDVLVVDMDWHLTFYSENAKDQAGQGKGWTGYTWDKHLFPNATAFLEWCASNGIQNTLNIHPASGVQPWEESYEEMAVAMGIDPATEVYVPFRPTDLKFMSNWMELSLNPREVEGTDFWWLDWQQGEAWIKDYDDVPLLNPTIWLNHAFFTNPTRWQMKTNPSVAHPDRPLIMHRWGGLGNHRYPLGFSGDVNPNWASLRFQPYFTATAANVGFAYWSHDLGGHTEPSPPELYTRWIQFGVFSPVFRTHCTKDSKNDRRIYTYDYEYFEVMRPLLQLRRKLVPYLYTQARKTYESGLAFVHPLYYEHPDMEAAYTYDHEYYFGDDIVVHPITEAVNEYQVSNHTSWIPPGTWYDMYTGEVFNGPMVVSRNYTLDEFPVLIQAGRAIPMNIITSSDIIGAAHSLPNYVRVMVYPNHVNDEKVMTAMYEDDGLSTAFEDGHHATTTFTTVTSDEGMSFRLVINPPSGENHFDTLPMTRGYVVEIMNSPVPEFITVNDQEVSRLTRYSWINPTDEKIPTMTSLSWRYLASSMTLQIIIPSHAIFDIDEVIVKFASSFPHNLMSKGMTRLVQRAMMSKSALDDLWGTRNQVYQDTYPSLVSANEIAMNLTYGLSSLPVDQLGDFFTSQLDAFQTNLVNAQTEIQAQTALTDAMKEQILTWIAL